MVGQHVAASCMTDLDSSRGLWTFSASHGEHLQTKDNDPIGTTLKKLLGGIGAKKDKYIPQKGVGSRRLEKLFNATKQIIPWNLLISFN